MPPSQNKRPIPAVGTGLPAVPPELARCARSCAAVTCGLPSRPTVGSGAPLEAHSSRLYAPAFTCSGSLSRLGRGYFSSASVCCLIIARRLLNVKERFGGQLATKSRSRKPSKECIASICTLVGMALTQCFRQAGLRMVRQNKELFSVKSSLF